MKIKELDSSHRCLLEHLDTYRKMKTSYEEMREYVNDVLRELARELNRQYQQQSLKFDEKTIPKGYLQTTDLPNWKASKQPLVAIGVEGLERGLGAIIGSTTVDQCYAYVYSPYCHSIKDDIGIDEVRRKLQPPDGFVLTTERGYLFKKDVAEVPIDDFCDRLALAKHFREPLTLLIDWLTKNKEGLRQAAKPTRG
jgi:hypothetical protein